MSADFATDNANLSMMKAGVNALISFGELAVKGAELGLQIEEMQDKKTQQEAEDKALDNV